MKIEPEIYLIVEHGPNGDTMVSISPSIDKAKEHIASRQSFWNGVVKINRAPPRTFSILRYTYAD